MSPETFSRVITCGPWIERETFYVFFSMLPSAGCTYTQLLTHLAPRAARAAFLLIALLLCTSGCNTLVVSVVITHVWPCLPVSSCWAFWNLFFFFFLSFLYICALDVTYSIGVSGILNNWATRTVLSALRVKGIGQHFGWNS